MNKLILVGNGFDLAHGLPTSYRDFLNDFWANIQNNYHDYLYQKIIYIDFEIKNSIEEYTFKCFEDFDKAMKELSKTLGFYYQGYNILAKKRINSNKNFLEVNNDFFKLINRKNSIENWVDIENEYYLELKKIVKSKESNSSKKEQILKLNQELEDIKGLLIKYLKEKVLQKFNVEKVINKTTFLEMYKIFKPNSSLNENKWNTLEFSITEDWKHIRDIYGEEKSTNKIKCYPYILNFNYTDSSFIYFLEIDNYSITTENCNMNSIHGEIDSEDFAPIFGFGDEMDEDYQLIENLDDNEYLHFFKAFQYFQNNNYNNLLWFLEEEKFQVCILGHSCGLSDRVMLNTIFEHENCRSIKIYYHQKEDGLDNYSDVVKNISRHFKDKPSMRRKIVNKELCSPLPQNVRFKKR